MTIEITLVNVTGLRIYDWYEINWEHRVVRIKESEHGDMIGFIPFESILKARIVN